MASNKTIPTSSTGGKNLYNDFDEIYLSRFHSSYSFFPDLKDLFNKEVLKPEFVSSSPYTDFSINNVIEIVESKIHNRTSDWSNIISAGYSSLIEGNSNNIKLHEGNIIKGWKLVSRISSLIIDIYDDKVLLECLVNEEKFEYEEWEFQASLFENLKVEVGKKFKIQVFQRGNQQMLEITDKIPIPKEHFKEVGFSEKIDPAKFFNYRGKNSL